MVEIRAVEYNLRNAEEYSNESRNDKAIGGTTTLTYEDVIETVDSDDVYDDEVYEALSQYKSEITPYDYRYGDTCTVYYAVYADEIETDYGEVVFAEWKD